jgi:hypothetical protein
VNEPRRPRDNRDRLIRVAVAGVVAGPRSDAEYRMHDESGTFRLLPGSGGIALGVHTGDVTGTFVADHLMVGASIADADAEPAAPGALHLLGCIGNPVRTADGQRLGVVAAKRGGLAPGLIAPQLLGVEASDDRLARLAPGDRVVLEASGRGLTLLDHPEVSLVNLSPGSLDALSLDERDGALTVAVRVVIPSRMAAAGIGSDPWIGDLEVDDGGTSLLPGDLRFGDLVAFSDIDATTTRFRHVGYVAIGLVAHGPSPAPGHGVGITILASGPAGRLRIVVQDDATLALWLIREGAQP